MSETEIDIDPSEADEQKFSVTEDGKLEKNDAAEANFEENLTFDE